MPAPNASSSTDPSRRVFSRLRITQYDVALIAIVVVAAFLRFYRLGVPGMWFDEILVPLTAGHPIDYIVERSLISDVHPPYYALLIKGMLRLGSGETLLRLPSALAGVAAVWLTQRIGRSLVSPVCGLYAAALLAVAPLHVILSRQVRPYALLLVAILLSLYFLTRLVRSFSLRDAVWFSLANVAVYCLHFVSFLVVGTELLLLLLLSLWSPRRGSPLAVLNVALANIALGAPTLVFFLSRRAEVGTPAPLVDTLVLAFRKYLEALFGGAPLAVLAVGACLILWGIWVLSRRDPRLGALLSLSVAIPLGALAAVGYNGYFNPWHLCFLLPPTLFLAASGLAALSGNNFLIPTVLCMGLGALVFQADFEKLYAADSYGDHRRVAEAIRDHAVQGDILVFPNAAWHNITRWYFDPAGHALPRPVVRPGRQCTPVILAWAEPGFGDLVATPEALRAGYGDPQILFQDQRLVLYRYCVGKRAPIPIPLLPGSLDLNFSLFEFHANVAALQNVMVDADGNRITTVANSIPGFFEYVFVPPEGHYPTDSIFILDYDNSGKGNELKVQCAFDDEPEALVFVSQGPDLRHAVPIHIVRNAPFRKLRLRIEMTSAPRTPGYLDNLQTLSIRHIKVFFQCPADTPASARQEQ